MGVFFVFFYRGNNPCVNSAQDSIHMPWVSQQWRSVVLPLCSTTCQNHFLMKESKRSPARKFQEWSLLLCVSVFSFFYSKHMFEMGLKQKLRRKPCSMPLGLNSTPLCLLSSQAADQHSQISCTLTERVQLSISTSTLTFLFHFRSRSLIPASLFLHVTLLPFTIWPKLGIL